MTVQHDTIPELMADIGRKARAAAAELAFATAERKHAALVAAAEAVWRRRAEIIAANGKDLEFGREKGLSAAMMDRLMLDEDRIRGIVDGLMTVADQPDPVGEVITEWDMASGLHIRRVRTPLGVVGVIYESRPNVTADAGALCLKAGNAVILRGGSESFHSSGAIHACLWRGCAPRASPRPDAARADARPGSGARDADHDRDHIDVIVPRGGKGLVGLVQRGGAGAGLCPSRGDLPCLCRQGGRSEPRRGRSCSTPRPGAPASAARRNACWCISDVAETLGQQIVEAI